MAADAFDEHPPTAERSRRLGSLDAVRGIAALSVLFAHIASTNRVVFHPGSITRWPEVVTVLSPLHVIWTGPDAVTVFFVLSGFVLSYPLLTRATGRWSAPTWFSYYPKRLVRLYLPAWGAILATYLIITVTPRHTIATGSAWLNAMAIAEPLRTALHDGALIFGTSRLDGPLWSLRLEVLYSLALPAVLVLTMAKFVPDWAKVTCLIILTFVAGATTSRTWVLFLTFALGSLLAARHLRGPGTLDVLPGWAWFVLLVGSLVAINAGPPLLLVHMQHSLTDGASRTLNVLGSVGVVAIAVEWRAAARALSTPVLEWLGSRSFSLYLIHFPIVLWLAVAIGPNHLAELFLVATAASLAAAEVFCRLIERPSHVLAKRVGLVASSLVAQRAA